jgi:glycine/sarcosine N-methyltransferase
MYDQFASDYDRFVNWNNRLAVELPFIEDLLEALPHPSNHPLQVLDAASGTGMHAIALARHGYSVSAADLSQAMTDKAALNAQAAGVQLKLKAAGFGTLANAFGAGTFDAVLCLGNSLPHLLTTADLKIALKDFAACLRPGGLLLIQNRNFDAVMAGQQRWMEPQPHSEGENEWLFMRFYDFEPDGLIRFNIVTLKRPLNGDWTPSITSTRLRPQKHKELTAALEEIGFTSMRVYGSMTGDLFVPLTSGNLVLSAVLSK